MLAGTSKLHSGSKVPPNPSTLGLLNLLHPLQGPIGVPASPPLPKCARLWLSTPAPVPRYICMFNQASQIHSTFADFFSQFGEVGAKHPCWVSHLDPNIAITELDLRRLKKEVMYSLVPLAVFILFTLYAFCRLGVFSICNPFRCCPTPADQAETATLTPKQLFR